MWQQTLRFDELVERDKWTVDYWAGRPSGSRSTAYATRRVGELCGERRNFIEPSEWPEHTFNYLGLANIEPLTGDLVDFEPVRGEEVRSRSKAFRAGDVLYARLRPYLNKVYLAEPPVREGVCSGEFYVLVADTDLVEPLYLREVLASAWVQEHIRGSHTGSALPRVSREDLFGIEVPVPPLDVQRDFVDKLRSEHTRRRALKRRVASYPERINEGLVASLETGASLDVTEGGSARVPEHVHPLPDQVRSE
jgi:hypothetical protein